ncbi:MAG TPA: IclR family transcriptional regulator [Microlunatus sp.]
MAKTAAATPRRPPGGVERDPDRDSAGVDVIAKVDAVLSVLEQRGETSAADIAELTGEPLSSVYRLLQSLTGVGWVDRGARRAAYRLGVLLLEVSSRLEDQLDIREVALPTLRQLLSDIGVTAFLCVRRDARAVCVERLEGLSVRSLAMQLGSSLPLYAGAAPRALLAFLPVDEQQAVLATAELAGDPARPDRATIENDIEQVRHRGYAISDGDVTPGIAALGAPVFDHRGHLAAAISISGLRSQVLGTQQERNIDLLLAGARAVGRALGQEVTV